MALPILTKKKKGKGEVFPEITKAAPGPSPSPQDHAAKLKERYLQRSLTLFKPLNFGVICYAADPEPIHLPVRVI